MRNAPKALLVALAIAALSGCGGGSSSSSSSSSGGGTGGSSQQPTVAGIVTPKAVSVVTTN